MNPLRLVIIADLEHVVIVRSRLEGVILEIERLFRPVGHDLKEAEAETCFDAHLPIFLRVLVFTIEQIVHETKQRRNDADHGSSAKSN